MKITRDMLFAAGTVVAVAIAFVAAVLLFGGISKFSSAEKKLKTSIKRLSQLYAEDPFPSDENVERERQNEERLNEWYGKLITSLREGEIAPDPADKSPSRFMELYGETTSLLRKEAGEAGVDLPKPVEEFAFGFDKYHGGDQPPPDDVPTLTQQLKIISMLCRFLIEEDVDSITRIEREALDAKATVMPRRAPRPRGGLVGPRTGPRRPSSSARPKKPKSTGNAAPKKPAPIGPLYAKQHFVLEFKARERPVLGVLNRLAKNEAFTVVTSVTMTRPDEDILTAEDTLRHAGVGSIPLADMQGDDYPSSVERMVCGADIEKPMMVTIKLNVYNFVGE